MLTFVSCRRRSRGIAAAMAGDLWATVLIAMMSKLRSQDGGELKVLA